MQKSPKNTHQSQQAPQATDEFNIPEIKANLKAAKASVQEILNEEECPPIFELFEAVIDNAEESLKRINKNADIDAMPIKEQARVFADLNMFSSVAMQIDSMFLGDEDEDEDDFDDEDDEDEDEDDSFDEDSEDEDSEEEEEEETTH